MARKLQQKADTLKRPGEGTIDLPFLVLFLLLLMIGLVMVFSASHANAYYQFGDSYFFIKQQLKWAVIGLFAVVATVIFVKPSLLKAAAVPSLAFAVIMLALVPFIGTVKNDAKRWIEFGGISVQPSEIAKLAVILSFAYFITRSGEKIKTFKYGILPYGVILSVIGVLLIKQPHYSALIITFAVGFALLLVGGVRLSWIGLFAGVAVPAGWIIVNSSSYAKSRIELWKDPFSDALGKGYQTIQSLYAIGSGGLFGLGLGQSRQKYLYIPEPQNDFVFSIACEELGFIGALIIILLFVALVWRGLLIAFRAPDRFCALVVTGIMIKVGLQAIINIAVVTNTLPNTGISLPFFSYGGSALLIQMVEMGIVLSISKYSKNQKI